MLQGPAVIAISLGSNSSDKYTCVATALEWLRETFQEVRSSSMYNTAPISGAGDDYCNAVAVCQCESRFTPEVVNGMLKEYERTHGRTSHTVTIDLDLVMYDDDILRPKDFQREYFQRGFKELDCHM